LQNRFGIGQVILMPMADQNIICGYSIQLDGPGELVGGDERIKEKVFP